LRESQVDQHNEQTNYPPLPWIATGLRQSNLFLIVAVEDTGPLANLADAGRKSADDEQPAQSQKRNSKVPKEGQEKDDSKADQVMVNILEVLPWNPNDDVGKSERKDDGAKQGS
jgi:hypothetical protein